MKRICKLWIKHVLQKRESKVYDSRKCGVILSSAYNFWNCKEDSIYDDEEKYYEIERGNMGNLTPEIIIRELENDFKQFIGAYGRILSYRSKAKAVNDLFSEEQKKELESIFKKFNKKVDSIYNYNHKGDE